MTLTMWASERELARLAANNLEMWANELNAADELALNDVGERLFVLVDDLRKLHAKSKSEQKNPS